MKIKLFFFFLLLSSLAVNAQIINIPDANFKAKLLSSSASNTVAKNANGNYFAIDTNNDGEIQQTEADQVVELNVSNSNIASLEGLSSFSLYSLDCSYNQIASIDLSSSYLFVLDCSHNQLTSLDVSYSIELTILNCSYNYLTTLSLYSSSSSYFSSIDCSHNQFINIANQFINI